MKKVNYILFPVLFVVIYACTSSAPAVFAQPYGTGKYNANIPYGSQTSLSIAASNVTIPAQASGTGQLSTKSTDVTVTSTDTIGYKLYITSSGSTSMTASSGGGSVPASGVVPPAAAAALPVDTWGYSTDGTNFLGITSTITGSSVPVKSFSGPTTAGDTTTITYGMKLDYLVPAGNYSASVLYTAVPQTT